MLSVLVRVQDDLLPSSLVSALRKTVMMLTLTLVWASLVT